MDADRARAQLARILASATFSDAERASKFLRFVVESALDGHSSTIKESVIGVDVLGRFTSSIRCTRPAASRRATWTGWENRSQRLSGVWIR